MADFRHPASLPRIGCILLVCSLFPVPPQEQQPAFPDSLVRTATAKFQATANDKTRFTYQILQHQTTYTEKGKKLDDSTSLSEMLYLSGHPYVRRLQVNGKPLSGKDLEEEQKRYEDAVKARAGLSEKQRSESAGGRYKGVSINLDRLLTDYTNSVAGNETVDGQACILVDAMPKPDIVELHRHVDLWINPAAQEIVKIAFDLLSDEDDLEQGSNGWMQMRMFEGRSVVTASHLDYRLRINRRKKSIFRSVTDSTMSNFRRFGSTSEIFPSNETDKP